MLISPLAAGYIWRGILDPEGPLNVVIAVVIPGFDWAWLGETSTALASVAFVDAWKWIGLTTLVYIAGLNGVPRELRKRPSSTAPARWTAFWKVVFPLLAPAFTFNIVITLIGAFNAYDVIAATTGGGPGDATQSINILLRAQYGLGNFGTASASGPDDHGHGRGRRHPAGVVAPTEGTMRTGRNTVVLRYGLLTLFAIAWVGVPIWLVVVNSFKTAGEAASLNLSLPSSWAALENYSDGDR